jgi:hypothetical protein
MLEVDLLWQLKDLLLTLLSVGLVIKIARGKATIIMNQIFNEPRGRGMVAWVERLSAKNVSKISRTVPKATHCVTNVIVA